MTGRRHLFLLCLGLCLVVPYVHSLPAEVHVYGGDPKNPYEDVTWQLEKQRSDKQKLETLLEKTTDSKQRSRIEKDLEKITSAIAKMEVKFRVVYKDHLEAIKTKTQDFENEKAKMKDELEAAEKRHADALADMEAAKKKGREQIGAYQAKIEESTNQMEKIERDYAALKEIQTQKLEKEKEEKEQLVKVRDELTKKLQAAQNLHAKAMEALSMSLSREILKQRGLPYGKEIKEYKIQVIALLNKNNKKQRLAGLTTMQASLKGLYEVLYNEGHLPRNIPHKELEHSLSAMKINAQETRTEQTNRRNALVELIQKKNLGEYTEQEIEALRKANEEVETSDLFLKEIARRKAFLKSIKELALLLKQCIDASKHAK